MNHEAELAYHSVAAAAQEATDAGNGVKKRDHGSHTGRVGKQIDLHNLYGDKPRDETADKTAVKDRAAEKIYDSFEKTEKLYILRKIAYIYKGIKEMPPDHNSDKYPKQEGYGRVVVKAPFADKSAKDESAKQGAYQGQQGVCSYCPTKNIYSRKHLRND